MNREGCAGINFAKGGTSFSGLCVLEKNLCFTSRTLEIPLVIGRGGLHFTPAIILRPLDSGRSRSGIAFARLEGLPTVVYANERRVAVAVARRL